MDTVILACNTLSEELALAMKETKKNYPIVWVASGLHNNPDLLKEGLQDELDKLENTKFVLLAFGFCGNAVLGLKAGNFKLILPRVDDCITLLIGSVDERKKISQAAGTYFLTKGWLDNEKNIWEEYKAMLKKYGKERADKLNKLMLAHYRNLAIVATGAYDINEFTKRSQIVADDLDLQHVIIPGTLNYLKKLLTGPYDSDFAVIEPNSKVTFTHLY